MLVLCKEKSHPSDADHAMNGCSDISIFLYSPPRKKEKAKVPWHQISVAVNVHPAISVSVQKNTKEATDFLSWKKKSEIVWSDKTMKVR